jgi:site-specific DNA-methyltransferase (adenine-specific)
MIALPLSPDILDTVIHGDALEVLRGMEDNSVDAIVTDPPAGINFMNKPFDDDRGGRDFWIAWLAKIMREALRVLKPGGHALVWALPRTSHWTATALEDAGFEVRDKLYHLFGSGFPKSTAIDKQIDKMAGAEREVIGSYRVGGNALTPVKLKGGTYGVSVPNSPPGDLPITKPATPEASQWQGWGTATKPAVEEWILCRKPISEKSIAANVLKWNTGGLNIDATRISHNEPIKTTERTEPRFRIYRDDTKPNASTIRSASPQGRFPSHLLLSHSIWCTPRHAPTQEAYDCAPDCPIRALDEQSGVRKSGGAGIHKAGKQGYHGNIRNFYTEGHASEGTASRYFQHFAPDAPDFVPFHYFPKSSRRERNEGCEDLPESSPWTSFDGQYAKGRNPITGERSEHEYKREQSNSHPTVKPLALMRWLIRLITPPGGIVLDCFAGSGSTCVAAIQEGVHFVGIEQSEEYVAIAEARIAHALRGASW